MKILNFENNICSNTNNQEDKIKEVPHVIKKVFKETVLYVLNY